MKLFYIKSTKYTNRKETNPDGITVYWGPNNSGYTMDIHKAGVYTENEIGNLDKHTTELIEIEAEPWDEIRINAWKRYSEEEDKYLKTVTDDLEKHRQGVENCEHMIERSKLSKKKFEHELLIQEKLRGK